MRLHVVLAIILAIGCFPANSQKQVRSDDLEFKTEYIEDFESEYNFKIEITCYVREVPILHYPMKDRENYRIRNHSTLSQYKYEVAEHNFCLLDSVIQQDTSYQSKIRKSEDIQYVVQILTTVLPKSSIHSIDDTVFRQILRKVLTEGVFYNPSEINGIFCFENEWEVIEKRYGENPNRIRQEYKSLYDRDLACLLKSQQQVFEYIKSKKCSDRSFFLCIDTDVGSLFHKDIFFEFSVSEDATGNLIMEKRLLNPAVYNLYANWQK